MTAEVELIIRREREGEKLHDTNVELEGTNVELEAADVAKDLFLANMSHELRTPLNAILGFTGTMLMELPGPLTDEQAKQLRTVQANGKHLLSIINDLLDLARIESGKVELNVEPIACRELAEEVVLGLRPLAEQKGIDMGWMAPEDDLEVRTDRRSLSQILINLTNNAIKFTDEGERPTRARAGRATTEARQPRFSVVDTGHGDQAGGPARSCSPPSSRSSPRPRGASRGPASASTSARAGRADRRHDHLRERVRQRQHVHARAARVGARRWRHAFSWSRTTRTT